MTRAAKHDESLLLRPNVGRRIRLKKPREDALLCRIACARRRTLLPELEGVAARGMDGVVEGQRLRPADYSVHAKSGHVYLREVVKLQGAAVVAALGVQCCCVMGVDAAGDIDDWCRHAEVSVLSVTAGAVTGRVERTRR